MATISVDGMVAVTARKTANGVAMAPTDRGRNTYRTSHTPAGLRAGGASNEQAGQRAPLGEMQLGGQAGVSEADVVIIQQ